MNFDDYADVFKFERRGRVLQMTLNMPDKLNSLAGDAHTAISKVFVDLTEDEDSDIIVITGAGRCFSAGGDIEYMQYLKDNPKVFYRVVREANRFIRSMVECDKIIISKVQGDALGLGSTLAVFSDVVIAAEHAKFGDPHNNVGLIAGDGGAIMWPLLIGHAKAKHYLYTGEKFDAREAERIGLILKAVPAEQLDAEVDAYCERLLKLPQQSLRWSKSTINTPLREMAATMMDIGMAYENVSSQTWDHQEAMNAFREKRKPKFGGGN